MAIFVLTSGDYNYRKIIMATTDVKAVAKAYVRIINEGGYGCLFKNPYIEIRIDGKEEELPETFWENTQKEQRLVKHLSKLARELEMESNSNETE